MALNLFFITNIPEIAVIAEKNGVDRIWIDLETLGKEERQKNQNSVKSKHSIKDISAVKSHLNTSELLVRVDPWNEKSEEQINAVINEGADIIMLPMWKSVEEVRNFLTAVDGRIRTTLLLETKEAVECIDEVLELDFDEIHIGLNDLHLSYGMDFMFEPLADGTVEDLCSKFRKKGLPYGFGGIASLGKGLLPAEMIIMEHYRLGSTRSILSRSFCDIGKCDGPDAIEELFRTNMVSLRKYEKKCEVAPESSFVKNAEDVRRRVSEIVQELRR